MEKVQAHTHCATCVSRYCKASDCPMVDCDNGCGAVAHQCKMKDHEEVCLSKTVPCINAHYGCETLLVRYKMKTHLSHCPASVVHCKFTWERVDRNIIAATDENDRCEGVKFAEDFLAHDEERAKSKLESEDKTKKLSMMLQPSAAHRLFIGVPYNQSYPYKRRIGVTVMSLSSSFCCFYMTTESINREQLHMLIKCNETIRRDEFEDHYKTQHSTIHSGLYGWLVHHCPLYEYGCNYSIPRLLPSPQYFELVYNKCSQVFAIKETKPPVVDSEDSEAVQGWYAARLQQQRELAAYGYSDIPVDPLSQLPTEVLHIIISFLDSSSLFCLSMTSRFLRETCHNAVKGNMVQLSWQKQKKDLVKDEEPTEVKDDTVEQLAQKQREADETMKDIIAMMRQISEQKIEVEKVVRQLCKDRVKLDETEQTIETELSSVEPLMIEAKEAVGNIKKEALSELRVLPMPPGVIKDILGAILRLMGTSDASWSEMRRFLAKQSMKEEMMSFDAHEITPEIRNAIQELLGKNMRSFDPDVAKRISVAAAPLAAWVKANMMYSSVLEKIAPLEQELASLSKNVEESENLLAELNGPLDDLRKKLYELRTRYEQSTAEVAMLKLDLDNESSGNKFARNKRYSVQSRWCSKQMWSYSRNAQVSFNWKFTNNDSAMNNHVQHCPHARVQRYDDNQLWWYLPDATGNCEYVRVPASSVSFNK